MAVTLSTDIGKSLTRLISGTFGKYKDRPTEWSQVFMTESTDQRFVEEVLMRGTGMASTKTEGRAYNLDSIGEGYTARYNIITVGLMLKISYEAVQDNLHESLASKAGMWLERSMRNYQEIQGANVLNNGFDSSFKIGDGVSLFSASHPVPGGVQSNTLATPADLSESSLEDLLTMIDSAKDDRGMIANIMPKKLVVPNGSRWTVERLLKSSQRTGTADNDINAINSLGAMPGSVLMRRLTDPDAWFITTDALDGLKFIQREGVRLKSSFDEDTEDYKFRIRQRYAFGVSDWRGVYGSQGA